MQVHSHDPGLDDIYSLHIYEHAVSYITHGTWTKPCPWNQIAQSLGLGAYPTHNCMTA